LVKYQLVGQAEQPEKNSNNVVSFSQAVVKQNSIKHSKPLSHVSKPQSYLPEQRQSSRIIGSNLCQKGDANHCEKEQKKKVAVESRVRDNSGGLEESIRNVTESLRCDPTFQDNLRNFLRNDNLNTWWFSLPPKNSESLQANSDAALPASETFITNKSKKQVGECGCKFVFLITLFGKVGTVVELLMTQRIKTVVWSLLWEEF